MLCAAESPAAKMASRDALPRPAAGAVMTYIRAGFGFNVGEDFARASHDIPIALAPPNMPSPVR